MPLESIGWPGVAKRQGAGLSRRVCVGSLCVPPVETGAGCLAGDVTGQQISDRDPQPNRFLRD